VLSTGLENAKEFILQKLLPDEEFLS